MAYMSQEKKVAIAAQLKTIIPHGWKWSLGVDHHSTIVLKIRSAPVDLLADVQWYNEARQTYANVNPYHWAKHFKGDVLSIFERIFTALNTGNWDRSDIQSDYHDVGHYVEVRIGEWNKPFVITGAAVAQAA